MTNPILDAEAIFYLHQETMNVNAAWRKYSPQGSIHMGAAETTQLGVAYRSFGITNPVSSYPESSNLGMSLDWRFSDPTGHIGLVTKWSNSNLS
ncbi:MAG: hypothetical protein MI756_11250 [Chromatiales bacterium]|nr:hypothetical protein [Chromatiales bacterium]